MNYNITKWDELNLNYWGITKVANTSMKLSLANKIANIDKTYNNTDLVRWVHKKNKVHYITCEEAITNGYKNFTVIRNPYKRFESMYKDLSRRPRHHKILKTVSIENFLNYLERTDDSKRDVHFRSQSWFIGKHYNNIIKFDIDNLDKLEQFLHIKLEYVNKGTNVMNFDKSIYHRVCKIYKNDFDLFGYKNDY